jgi:hypothetical protein
LQSDFKPDWGASCTLSTEDLSVSDFNIFPNPSSNKITIQLNNNSELKRLSLYDNLGRFVKSHTSSVINVSDMSTGVYFLKIETNQGTSSKKVIIE